MASYTFPISGISKTQVTLKTGVFECLAFSVNDTITDKTNVTSIILQNTTPLAYKIEDLTVFFTCTNTNGVLSFNTPIPIDGEIYLTDHINIKRPNAYTFRMCYDDELVVDQWVMNPSINYTFSLPLLAVIFNDDTVYFPRYNLEFLTSYYTITTINFPVITVNLNWYVAGATIQYTSILQSFNDDIKGYRPETDPYNPGGETEGEIGGEGDFDNTSDPIPEASLPILSAVDARFISIYTPSLPQLQALANYMWSPLFDLDTLKKLFADPMKVILGLSILPIAVPHPVQPQPITIGNISTNVDMYKASQQYIQIDCGTLNVNEYWGAYLDYSPYTKLEIYLPYIGTKQISVDDVMNKACHVYYNIDILTGACCAMIKCDDSVLYSYAGQCATSIPITGSDWTNVVSGALSTALSVVGVAAGAVTGSAPLTGASAIGLVSSASQNVMQMKPIIEKSGSLGGSAGMLGVQSPYLILTRPRQALPKDQNIFTGYPSYINMKLGDLAGMTFVEQVHLENIPCTSSEQSEIETLLKGGVIF